MKYCNVRGQWTTAISDIDTTCRFYSPSMGCSKKGACKHKTSNPKARFIGKTLKSVKDNSLIFEDGSVLECDGMSKGLKQALAEAGIV